MTDILNNKFTIGTKEYERDFQEDLSIDPADINTCIVNHPAQFAWYATAYELCNDHEQRLKAKLDRMYAQLDCSVRIEAEAHGIKMTEPKIKNTILDRPEYVETQTAYFEASRNTGLAKAARDAMMHRKDMLVNLASNYRAEGSSDISLKTEHMKREKK